MLVLEEVYANCISLYEQTTLIALGEMFEAARSIMSWLGDCAKVSWTEFSSFGLFSILIFWHRT